MLRSTARLTLAAALSALAAKLLLRGPPPTTGYCARAGRCGGCGVHAECDVYQALHAGTER